ncbi:MAG: division/cell wall cluster transcriptional repressor MraZ [Gammaproteobacteria bacterium]|nr:division/cell wall cluster transcriptional repressor MraZ [Gammaproteobacteria bacterium]
MFRGITAVSLDVKGRLAMPARQRDLLLEIDEKAQLVVTIDTQSPCLLLYPLAEWEIIERKLEALPSFNPATRRLQRLLMGHASEVEMDGQGRILIPPLLRDYAKLDKRVMVVGQGQKFELWSDTLWDAQREVWLAEDQAMNSDGLPPELQHISL